MVNMIWEKTSLLRRGYCSGSVCMAHVPSQALRDPHVLPLDCAAFGSDEGWHNSTSEFGQDWFAYRNFFRGLSGVSGTSGGIYVDVGTSFPFEYSNTVAFDRCLQWQGICVEPNPYLRPLLETYRNCTVVPNCVDEERRRGKGFFDRDGTFIFSADCLPLSEILGRAGLYGRRVDVLSIDVEHSELRTLRGLKLDQFDIRVIIIEVTPGATWLEVDTVILPWGYAKVAVLGRDVVYVKLEELGSSNLAAWGSRDQSDRLLAMKLPSDWAYFQQRVLDEEIEAEKKREQDAESKGLRRR